MKRNINIFIILLPIFIACYLSYLLTSYTLTNKLQSVFVFIYFFIVLLIINILISKKTVFLIKKEKIFLLLLSFLVAGGILYTNFSTIIPKYYGTNIIKIIPMEEVNPLSHNSEIAITSIKFSDKEMNLYGITQPGWEYNSNLSALFNNTKNSDDILELEFKNSKEIAITFNTNDWGGKVKIISQSGEEKSIDLYSKVKGEKTCIIYTLPQKINKYFLYYICFCAFLFWEQCIYIVLVVLKMKYSIYVKNRMRENE